MCHGNTVLLEWQFDKHQDNLPLQLSFIIEYNTSHNPNEWVVAARLSADDRRAKITVPMWTTFTFRVKAVNEMGVGKASAISHTKCKTPPGRPDRHPRNVRTIGDKMSYLVVEWEVRQHLHYLLNHLKFRRYNRNRRTCLASLMTCFCSDIGTCQAFLLATHLPFLPQDSGLE